MLTKKVNYTDFNGRAREESLMFNLNKAELYELQMTTEGGFDQYLKKISDKNDYPAMVKLFKDMIKMSYGIMSDDGKRFVKSEKATEEFLQTEAYSELYMSLVTDEKAAAEFMLGIMPANVAEMAAKLEAENTAKITAIANASVETAGTPATV